MVDPNTNNSNGTSAYVYTYDDNGNITGVQLPENQSETYTYDTQNNLTKEQDANQNVSTYDYDSDNNQTEATDANVQTSASRYDSKGNLLNYTQPMSAADNLMINPSFEQDDNQDQWPDHWEKLTQSGTTATFNWTDSGKFGKAISITNPTGWAVVRSDKFDYKTGDQYIASAYVKTDQTVGTALLKIEYFDAQSNLLGQDFSAGIKGTNDWTRLQTTIDNVPANTAKISVAVGLNPGSGTAFFDGVQLEKGSILSAYNLVDNSSFERDANGDHIPDGWTTSNNFSSNDKIVQNVNSDDDNVYIGQNSFQLTGESGKNKSIKQHINLSGDQNTQLTLSGWSKQSGASTSGGYYALQVAINYTDGTVDWDYANDFDKTRTDWQHVAAEVKPKKAFNSIDVYYYYFNQTGTAWFDAMRLEVGASHTFNTYDTGGNYITSVKDPLGHTISNSYDAVGNQTSTTDGNGNQTSFVYDGRNLLTKVTDALQGVTSYGYDGNGNRTTVTDAKGNISKYDYNEFNLVSKITNPLNQVIQFEYDKDGNQTKLTTPNGDSIASIYDNLNRLKETDINGAKKWTYGYDPNGNVTSVTDAAGKGSTFTYDKNDRLTKQVDGTNAIEYSYDNNDNLTLQKTTAGATSVSTNFVYNNLNQLISLSRNGSNQATFIYDERGNVISIKRANGTYTGTDFDSANQLNTLKNFLTDGSLLNSYKYTYDANGNITHIDTDKGSISYEYDALNQLTKETLTDGTTITYTYDAVGNRIKKVVTKGGSSTTTNYTYDAGNELTGVNGLAYTYDKNGNLTNDGKKNVYL